MQSHRVAVVVATLALGALASAASAQSIGTFRWQQQPYCNVLTLSVVQAGGVYQLDGTDDQCGAPTQAAVSGLAFPNANGTIGMGLTVVTTPGGLPLHIDATISLATLGGTWRDSTGATGAFPFTPGAGTGGGVRPIPVPSFPAGLTVNGGTISNVAAPVAGTDAANKSYVDASTSTVRSAMQNSLTWAALVNSAGTKGSVGRYTVSTSGPGVYTVSFATAGLGIIQRGQAVWTATPLCAGFTVAITFRSLTIGLDGTVSAFGVSVETHNSSGVATNCGVSVTATMPQPDAGSTVPPLVNSGGTETVCTSDGVSEVCVARKPD